MMDGDDSGIDICRVCRSEGASEGPLFHPCICTGSIKFIHQECLVQWMKYSRKEFCELCGYRFSFTPIYSPDMPRRLPITDIIGGILSSAISAIKHWLHYTLVVIAWLGMVPLTACRIYRCLFSGSLDVVLSLPMQILSLENMAADIFYGSFVVVGTLFAVIGLAWLRDQIVHGGGPEWLQHENIAAPLNEEEDEQIQEQPENNQYNPLNNNELEENPIVQNNQNNMIIGEQLQNAPLNPLPIQDEGDPNGADDNNWIPMDWERAVDELTWERLLGLDGTLLFLEHVFWVISLNTLFIIVFAFFPYHIGLLSLSLFGFREPAPGNNFEGLLTTLAGYCCIGTLFIILHRVAALFGLIKARRALGLGYLIVKVGLLSVVEVTIVPLLCGWWIDICSLAMFDASLKDRESNFKIAPGTSIFIHWLVGMVYLYYLASFILLLREILRPGVLWFLRNLSDPDYSPIQEMIHLPMARHIRRFLSSIILFGTAALLMIWLPVRILCTFCPKFLPYTVTVGNEAQVNELSLELLLLQVIIPGLLEQSQIRVWLKSVVRTWCKGVSWLLNIHSYLLGDDDTTRPSPAPAAAEPAGGLAAAHQALVMRGASGAGFQPYESPAFFPLRILILLLLLSVTVVIASLITLAVPVWIGRNIMVLWLMGSFTSNAQYSSAPPTISKIHELYTAACGTYMCWMIARGISIVLSWLPQGRAAMIERLKHWCITGSKIFIVAVLLFGLIPLLSGLLLEVVIIIPLRVPLFQTPIIFIWQDWALGVLYTKIVCAVTLMGPEWFLRTAIERIYRDGIHDMDVVFIIKELAIPVVVCCGLALAIPYCIAYSIVPLFEQNVFFSGLVARWIYPLLLIFVIGASIVITQVKQFKKLYVHIKNDKYLVGQRLVNYDHRHAKSSTQ